MMTLGSTGVIPLLATAGALDKEGVAACVGAVGDVVVGGVALMTGADHILGDALASPAVECKVLAQEVGLDLGLGLDVSSVAGDTSLELWIRCGKNKNVRSGPCNLY